MMNEKLFNFLRKEYSLYIHMQYSIIHFALQHTKPVIRSSYEEVADYDIRLTRKLRYQKDLVLALIYGLNSITEQSTYYF